MAGNGPKGAAPRRAGTRPHAICRVSELPPGGRRIVDVGSRSVGVFNAHGGFLRAAQSLPAPGRTALPRNDHPAPPAPASQVSSSGSGKARSCAAHGTAGSSTLQAGARSSILIDYGSGTYDVTVEQREAEEDPSVEQFDVTVEDGWVVLHA